MSSRVQRRGRVVSHASFSIIAVLFLLLSTTLAAGVTNQLHRISQIPLGSVTPKYLVLIVLDGARPDYFHITSLPHIDALRTQGIEYDRAFAGILESETPSGHAALSTGSTPARDGLLGFNWIKDNRDAVRLFDPNVVRQGAIEHVMQNSGAPTIASLFKQKYPKAKVVAISGHKYYAADPLGGPAADYIMYYAADAKNRYVPTAIPAHMPPQSILSDPSLIWPSTTMPTGAEDTLAVNLAIKTFQTVRQQVTLINLPEFDWPLGHVDGSDPAKTKVLMQAFDRDLGRIEDAYRQAGVLDQTEFILTADHGMAPLTTQIPDSIMDDAVTAAGATNLETTYSTAGYIWLHDANTAKTVADKVVAKNDPHVQSVYYRVKSSKGDSYVHDGGLSISPQVDSANQYLLKSFLGGNAPDVVVFCTDHTAFVTKGAETWKGNHGGAAWESQHMPLIISGPGITASVVSHSPARLEDIAPTALASMQVNPKAMEGTVLADALTDPTAQQVTGQSNLNQTLNPVVDALASQSTQEVQNAAK